MKNTVYKIITYSDIRVYQVSLATIKSKIDREACHKNLSFFNEELDDLSAELLCVSRHFLDDDARVLLRKIKKDLGECYAKLNLRENHGLSP